ncbi:MAG: A/G-specific adenine glycosylase [Gammaproteobacteria bacterium]|nr:A/G-specific adenine glycosylase [Gammaproteobacteria bacterium]
MSEEEFSNRLLAWHRRAGRKDLPWQRNPSTYRVWVSEIMLQQTQVASVIPYFNRFMARFPDVSRLADAALDDVLHLWSGLGYYARARNLHRAAQQIRDDHRGRFPEEFEQLLSLPGVGRSTAGAVLSLALGRSHPILDGNVKRVLTRFFAVTGWPGEAAVQQRLWAIAERLTPRTQAGIYNQAMMDLGAGVCTRRNPACADCPLSDQCRAYAEGDPLRYPASRMRQKLPSKAVRLLLLQRDRGTLLLERRPPNGIWGGLWSLPECDPDADPVGHCATRLGLKVVNVRDFPRRRHSFTHFHLDIHPLVLQVEASGECVMDECGRVWYNTAKPDRRGLAAPVARLIAEFRALTIGENE